MARDPLLTTLLDLDAILESQELIIGGGYGLYLKQLYLKQNPQIRTLFPPHALPSARQASSRRGLDRSRDDLARCTSYDIPP